MDYSIVFLVLGLIFSIIGIALFFYYTIYFRKNGKIIEGQITGFKRYSTTQSVYPIITYHHPILNKKISYETAVGRISKKSLGKKVNLYFIIKKNDQVKIKESKEIFLIPLMTLFFGVLFFFLGIFYFNNGSV